MGIKMIDIIIDVIDDDIEALKRTISSICVQQNAADVFIHINKNVDKKVIEHFSNFAKINITLNDLSTVTGDYVMYFNSGDVFANSNCLSMLYKYKENDIIIGGYAIIRRKNKFKEKYEDKYNFYGKLFKTDIIKLNKLNIFDKAEVSKLACLYTKKIFYLKQLIYLKSNSKCKRNKQKIKNKLFSSILKGIHK